MNRMEQQFPCRTEESHPAHASSDAALPLAEPAQAAAKSAPAAVKSGPAVAASAPAAAPESPGRKQIREHVGVFAGASMLYALFYTFCLYKNTSGITSPFFVGGTLFFFCFCMKRLGVPFKKDAPFYLISLLLLGTSVFLTDDARLNLITRLGIFLLLVTFLLHHFYSDEKWTLGKYVSALLRTAGDTAGCAFYPAGDPASALRKKKTGGSKNAASVFYGILIAVPLVFVILLLLTGADRIFAQLFERMFGLLDHLFFPQNLVGIIALVLWIYVLSYCFLNALAKRSIPEETADRRTRDALTAITFTSIIAFIYVVFVAVQAAGLLFGERLLPEGYTYARYAREGFFQLLFVSLLNLALVLLCMAYFREHRVLRGMLTLICICTYCMIVSSAVRMLLYIGQYHLTFLRILVLWALFVLVLLITGVLVSIYKKGFPLFRFGMAAVTACYLVLAFSHPDYWIARYNCSRLVSEAVSQADSALPDDAYGYLRSLSADAAPALDAYVERLPGLAQYFERQEQKTQDMSLRSFNLSRWLAGRKAAELP